MLTLLLSVGSFRLSLNFGFESDDEDDAEDEDDSPVLPFGFVMAERSEPAGDPVFREI